MNGANGRVRPDGLVNTIIERQDDVDRHSSVSVVVSFIPGHFYSAIEQWTEWFSIVCTTMRGTFVKKNLHTAVSRPQRWYLETVRWKV